MVLFVDRKTHSALNALSSSCEEHFGFFDTVKLHVGLIRIFGKPKAEQLLREATGELIEFKVKESDDGEST